MMNQKGSKFKRSELLFGIVVLKNCGSEALKEIWWLTGRVMTGPTDDSAPVPYAWSELWRRPGLSRRYLWDPVCWQRNIVSLCYKRWDNKDQYRLLMVDAWCVLCRTRFAQCAFRLFSTLLDAARPSNDTFAELLSASQLQQWDPGPDVLLALVPEPFVRDIWWLNIRWYLPRTKIWRHCFASDIMWRGISTT